MARRRRVSWKQSWQESSSSLSETSDEIGGPIAVLVRAAWWWTFGVPDKQRW